MTLRWIDSDSAIMLIKHGQYNQIHSHIGDFSVYISNESLIETTGNNFSDEYIYSKDDIIGIISDFKERTGGDIGNRFVDIPNSIDCPIIANYLRFFLTQKGYVCTTTGSSFLKKSFFNRQLTSIFEGRSNVFV